MADPSSHREPHPDVAGHVLGTLEPDEARRFADHLAGCQACLTELGELAALPALLADVPPAEMLPPGLEERTFGAIAAAAIRGQPGAPVPAGRTARGHRSASRAERGAVVPIAHAAQAPRWHRGRLLVAAAAAVAVVAVGAGVISSLGSRARAPVTTIGLIATDGGPAHGTATVRPTPTGLTIDMSVESLAPSPPGKFYTCWLVGPGDSLSHPNRVSVGSFAGHGSGTIHVYWTAVADLRRFPTLGLTLEPDNGNPSHQGPKILEGSSG